MRKAVLYILSSVIAIITSVIVITQITHVRLDLIRPKEPLYIVIAQACFFGQVLGIALEVHVLLRKALGIRISPKDVIKVVFAQTYMALLVPFLYVGSEVISVVYLSSRGYPTRRIIEGISMRYAIDTIVISMMALILASHLLPVISIIAIIALISSAVLLAMILNAKFGNFMVYVIEKMRQKMPFLNRLLGPLEIGHAGDMKLHYVMLAFPISALQWLIYGLIPTSILRGLGVKDQLTNGLLIASSYVMLTLISILPGSAGIGELANFYVLSSLGLSWAYTTYTVLFRIITYVVPLACLSAFFIKIVDELLR